MPAQAQTPKFVAAKKSNVSDLNTITAVAVDAFGNRYVADTTLGVLAIAPNGTRTTLASSLTDVGGLAVDASGNVFATDRTNAKIVKISGGSVSDVVTAVSNPAGIAVDSAGVLYFGVNQGVSASVMKYAAGSLSTVAHVPGAPSGVAVDAAGNVYATDQEGGSVLSIDRTGNVAVVKSGLSRPTGLAVDRAGDVLVSDTGNNQVLRLSSGSTVTLDAGGALAPGALAVDSAKNVYVAVGPHIQLLTDASSVDFGSSNIGTTGTPITLNFNIPSGTPTASIAFPGNFTAGTVSCTSTGSGELCSVPVTFAPTSPGLRKNAIFLKNGSTVLATTLLYGIGNGPLGVFEPPKETVFGTGLSQPYQNAVDEAGNVYIADTGNQEVVKVTASGTQTTIINASNSGVSASSYNPYGVAVDGAGDLFVVDAKAGVLKEYVADGNGGITFPPVEIDSAYIGGPLSLALDGAGNLYFADQVNNLVGEWNRSSGVVSAPVPSVQNPTGVAVDLSGNLYVSSNHSGDVKKFPAGSGTGTVFASGFAAPTNMVFDASGNLYVADEGNQNGLIFRVAPSGTVTSLAVPNLAAPAGIAIDSNGNLFVNDYGAGLTYKLDRTVESLTFGSTAVGQNSPAQDVAVVNAGNAALIFSSVSVSADFNTGGAHTTCSNTSTILAGTDCIFGIRFKPTAVGTVSGSVNITDNSSNETPALQKISLTGGATQTLGSFAIAGPTSVVAGNFPTYTVQALDTLGNADPGFSGTLTVNVTGSISTSVTLTNGSGTFTLPTALTTAGTYTLAVVSGNARGGLGVTITNAPATKLLITGLPATSGQGAAVTFTVTAVDPYGNTAANFAGTVSFTGTDTSGAYPANYTFVGADLGAHTFSVTFNTLGTQSITASSSGLTAATASTEVVSGTFVDFGNVPVNTSVTKSVVIQVSGATAPTLSLAFGKEFSIGTPSCTTGSGTASCSASVTFTPLYPGLREDALLAKDSNGNLLKTIYMFGNGTGPLALVDPTGANIVGASVNASFVSPDAVAIDMAGNVYLGDSDASSVYEVPANGSPVVTVASSVGDPTGVAVDGAGNVYIADSLHNQVLKVAPGATTPVVVPLTGLVSPYGLAVDQYGNLFVADAGANSVIEYSQSGTQSTVGATGLNSPYGVAVDKAGDVYIADSGNKQIVLVPAGGGAQTTVGSNFTNPRGVAVDAAGDVYVADINAGNIIQILPDGTQAPLQGGYGSTYAVALDGGGNIYVADYVNKQVLQLVRTSGFMKFPATAIGQTSAAQTTHLLNAGNVTLTVSGLQVGLGTPPNLTPTVFAQSGGNCASGATLSQGQECGLSLTFSPTAGGTSTGDARFTDNGVIVNGNIQDIVLEGTSAQNTSTLTLTPPASPVYGTAINVGAAVTPSSPAATGSISYTVDGGTAQTSAALASGAVNLPLGILAAGTHTLNATYAGDGTYGPATASISFTVGKAQLTVNAYPQTKVYGAPIPTLTYTVNGLVNGDTQSVLTGALGTTAFASSPVGQYPITLGTLTAANYTIYFNANTLTITPAALTVKATDLSRAYGAANPPLTYTATGFVNGDNSLIITGALATTATVTSPVGQYPITQGTLAAPNYTINFTPGTLTVTQATVMVTANNLSRAYGAANPPLTYTVTGLQNGDAPAVITGQLATTATTTSPAGKYPITQGTLTSTNYTISFTPGTLTVTGAVLNVTANNATRMYGAPNPAFTYTVDPSGLKNGDTVSVVSGSPDTVANATSPVGTYQITQGTVSAANYTINFIDGTLTVTQAGLTITANDASRPVTTPNPVFTGTTAGLVNGDQIAVTYSTTATTASPVGTYPIIPSATGTALTNYHVTYVNGTLYVTGGTITVQADNKSRVYGTPNPAFTGTITGASSSDQFTLTFTTPATQASNVGDYPIIPAIAGANLKDYSYLIVAGVLTVTQAPTTTTLSSSTSTFYPGASVTLTAAVASTTTGIPTGSVTFIDGNSLLGTVQLSAGTAALTTAAVTSVGPHNVVAVYSGDLNFLGSSSSAAGVNVASPFTIAMSPDTLNLTLRQTGTTTLTITPAADFSGTVALSCGLGPEYSNCVFSKTSLDLKAGAAQTVKLQLQTAYDPYMKHNGKLDPPKVRETNPILPAVVWLPGMLISGLAFRRKQLRRWQRVAMGTVVLAMGLAGAMGLSGCGNGSPFFTVPGNYIQPINGVSGGVTVTADLKVVMAK